MAFNIKDPETDRLARELAHETGESLTSAVAIALRERLRRIRGRHESRGLAEDIEAIARRASALPEIPGPEQPEYDEHGLPR